MENSETRNWARAAIGKITNEREQLETHITQEVCNITLVVEELTSRMLQNQIFTMKGGTKQDLEILTKCRQIIECINRQT